MYPVKCFISTKKPSGTPAEVRVPQVEPPLFSEANEPKEEHHLSTLT
jgi:hypothetical protein